MKWWNYLMFAAVLAAAGLVRADAVKLSAYERAQGWRLLFDGQSLADWRGYQANKVPANWHAEDGKLYGAAGLALVSTEEFADFELSFDWKVSAGGRGEVYFHADEEAKTPAESGPVMELAGHGAVIGGAAGLAQPQRALTPQVDVWYQAKIVVFGYQVEYWINGDKVTAYTIDMPDWRQALAASPYRQIRDFGRLRAGRIVLSGDGVVFHNIKVRGL